MPRAARRDAVNLAETSRHQGGERLRHQRARRLAARRRPPTRSASTATTAASSRATSCASTACRPRLLVASAAAGSESVHELTNPALPLAGRPAAAAAEPPAPARARDRRRRHEVEETLLVHSYDREPLELDVDLQLAADFEPMLAIRGIVSAGPRRPAEIVHSERGVRFSLLGRDEMHRATTVRADRPCEPGDAAGRAALRSSRCRPARRRRSCCATSCTRAPSRRRRRHRRPRRAARGTAGRAWLDERTRSWADDELFNRVLERSLLDIRMLRSRHGADGYYAAGRAVVRDAVRARLADHGDADAGVRPGDGGARRCACWPACSARRDDPAHDEEPGKVHPRAARRRGRAARPHAAGALLRHRRRDAAVPLPALRARRLERRPLAVPTSCAPQVDAMLGWIDGPGDRDGDGLLEYRRARTGRPAQPGLEGLRRGRPRRARHAARAADRAGRAAGVRAARQAARSRALFALDGDERRARRAAAPRPARCASGSSASGCPSAATTRWASARDGRPSEALASNQGHLLWALAVPPERAGAIRDALMSAAMFSGWGIRTLASGERGLQPGRLPPRHGLAARHGDDRRRACASTASTRTSPRSSRRCWRRRPHAEGYRLPELFAGLLAHGVRDAGALPGRLPAAGVGRGRDPVPACTRGLGLVPDALERRLRIRRPSLPRWLDRVEVRGLRIADARVDLLFERTGERRPGRARRRADRRATSRSCSRSGPRGHRAAPATDRGTRGARPSRSRTPSARRRSTPGRGWPPGRARARRPRVTA